MEELPFLILRFKAGDRRNNSYRDRIICITKLLVQGSMKVILKNRKTNLHVLIQENWLVLHFLLFNAALEIYLGQSFGFDLPLPQETESIV